MAEQIAVESAVRVTLPDGTQAVGLVTELDGDQATVVDAVGEPIGIFETSDLELI